LRGYLGDQLGDQHFRLIPYFLLLDTGCFVRHHLNRWPPLLAFELVFMIEFSILTFQNNAVLSQTVHQGDDELYAN